MPTPQFLEQRHGVYFYRRDVPQAYRQAIGFKVWKISLGTGSRTEAERLARAHAVDHDALLAALKRGGAAAASALTEWAAKIEAAAVERLKATQRAISSRKLDAAQAKALRQRHAQLLHDGRTRVAQVRAAAQKHAASAADLTALGGVSGALQALRVSNTRAAFLSAAAADLGPSTLPPAIAAVRPDDLDEPEQTEMERLAARGAHAELLDELRDEKAIAERLRAALQPTGLIPKRPATSTASGPVITEIFDKWLASQGQREETSRKWKTYKRRLVDVIGDKAVRDVSKADIREYVEAVAQLPDAATLPPTARGGTVQALLDWAESETDPKLVTAATVGKHLDFARAFFRWCARQDYCESNPAQDIQAPKDTRGEDDRVRPFTWTELQRLVEAARTAWGAPSARTLIVLAGIYTGARLEEICQLAPSNLEQRGSIYAIRIDAKDGRQLKNEASRRVVPLPQVLIDMGFVTFASAKTNADTIFGLPRVMGRYGRGFSPHFRRLRESVGLDGPRLRFHSLRHSYADLLRARKVPDDASAQLMGHVGNRVRAGYGVGYDLETLHSWVNLLEPL